MAYLFSINFNVGNVIFKNGRYINLRKLVLGEDDE